MIAGVSINEDEECSVSKSKHDCIVTARDWITRWSGDSVETDVVDTKSPDEVIDVGAVFLMGFRGESNPEAPWGCHIRFDKLQF